MLNKAIIFLLLFFICDGLLIGETKADELNIATETSKKYNFSICAIFKNEVKYLKEWIEYHRILGVDHFYLYNTGSEDSFQEVLSPYIKEGIVTLIDWPEALGYSDYRWALSTQVPAYENAVNFIAKHQTKWLMFVDIDEFLVCPKGNIKDLLQKYDDYPGISLSSDFFDAGMHNAFRQNALIIQTVELTKPPKQIMDISISKMIFKPDFCKGFLWPPYQCRFEHPKSSIKVDRQEMRINCYLNRNSEYSQMGKKTKHMRNDDYRNLSETEIAALLEQGYVIEDQDRPIYQHIPELLKRIGKN